MLVDNYPLVRQTLEKYGFNGVTWSQLQEETELDQEQLYQIVGRGFKLGAFEMFQRDNVQYYRNRPKAKKLYPKTRS